MLRLAEHPATIPIHPIRQTVTSEIIVSARLLPASYLCEFRQYTTGYMPRMDLFLQRHLLLPVILS